MQTQQERMPSPQKRGLSAVLWCLPFVALAHIAWYYPQLPDRMASHFGPSGEADGWMSKLGFAIAYLSFTAVYTVLFGSMRLLLRKTPTELINLPNREYWLAPERREATILAMSRQLTLFGIAIGAFFIAVMQTIFLTNLGGSAQLSSLFFVYLVVFLIYTGIWSLQMLKQFRVPTG